MVPTMFHDRAEAGRLLAAELRDAPMKNPLVLAIPRGGVEVGGALAEGIGADLDVVLSRKLRSPIQPELALGAVSESGEVYLNPGAGVLDYGFDRTIEAERRHQVAEIERRRRLYRAVRPSAPVEGRTVIVTDDGLATGSTMIAALRTVCARRPHEVIVALPVAPPERLKGLRALCDRIVCLIVASDFIAVGQFYEQFEAVTDERAMDILRSAKRPE